MYNYPINTHEKLTSPIEFRKPPLPPGSVKTTLDLTTTTKFPIPQSPLYQPVPPPQTPTSPFASSTYTNQAAYNFKSISSANSPVTTPGYSSPPPTSEMTYSYSQHANNKYFSQQQQHQQQMQNASLPTSTSSSSLPSFVTNQANNPIPNFTNNLASNIFSHNSSRSFSDINDVLTQHSVILSGNQIGLGLTSTTNSMSPLSSLATTPTSTNPLSSTFLRIFIGTSTAVVSLFMILFFLLFCENKLKFSYWVEHTRTKYKKFLNSF